jgi:cysteine-S-conjugate beta-lyase
MAVGARSDWGHRLSSPSEYRDLGSLKWTTYDEDVLAAWVAEMDFGLAPEVIEALHDAVDRGMTGYPYPDIETATAVAACDFWADRFGWDVDPGWVYPAPDVIEGLRRCIEHLTRPGSPVALHTPVYFPFFSMVERAGREIIEVPSSRDPEGRFRLELDGIDRAFTQGAGAVVLCNPWNPTGRVLSADEIAPVIEMARRHDARVFSDEVHGPITYDLAHVPAAGIDPDTVATVTAASKAWNIPGLKSAQVVLTNPVDREIWERYFTPDKVGVGTFGLVASIAAYEEGRSWLDEVLARLRRARDLVTRLVAERLPMVGMSPVDGTYLAWLDFSAYDIDDPAEHLLDHARVALSSGAPFRGDSSRFARLNFATDEETLVKILERIADALDASGG